MTTPAATTVTRNHCVPRGNACRVSASAAPAKAAATTALPDPIKSGARPATANLVNGTVSENAATPRKPSHKPAALEWDNALRR